MKIISDRERAGGHGTRRPAAFGFLAPRRLTKESVATSARQSIPKTTTRRDDAPKAERRRVKGQDRLSHRIRPVVV